MTRHYRFVDDTPTKADYVALAHFRKALRKFVRFAEAGAREAGLTPQQHQLLLAARGHPDRDWASVGELADALQLSHHATVGLVDRCQTAGLVRREAHPDDHRVVRVSLTDRGEALLAALTVRNRTELRALGALTRVLESLEG